MSSAVACDRCARPGQSDGDHRIPRGWVCFVAYDHEDAYAKDLNDVTLCLGCANALRDFLNPPLPIRTAAKVDSVDVVRGKISAQATLIDVAARIYQPPPTAERTIEAAASQAILAARRIVEMARSEAHLMVEQSLRGADESTR